MLRLINWDKEDADWRLDVLASICTQTLDYANKRGYKNVILESIEDNTLTDPANQRYDIQILFDRTEENVIGQKLLMMKGEVIDCKTFHRRYEEYYGSI